MKVKFLFLIMLILSVTSFAFEEKVDNFVLTGYDENNQKKWELFGRNADIHEKDIVLNQVKAKSYEKNGVIDIKADKGFVNKSQKMISLKNNVVVKDSQGSLLYTDLLNWYQEKDMVETNEPLRIVKDQNEITGIGGSVETNFSKAVINKDVKFRMIPQTIITSEGPLNVNYKKNIAVFNRNVHVVDRKGELYCDKLVVFFDPKKEKVIKAHAQGNVRLRRGNSWSYSREAIYDVDKGNVTLLGRPKLEIYPK